MTLNPIDLNSKVKKKAPGDPGSSDSALSEGQLKGLAEAKL